MPVKRLLLLILTVVFLLGGLSAMAQSDGAASEDAAGIGTAPLQGEVYQADYVLGAGDTVTVRDANMGLLVSRARVLMDGSVHLPLLGKVYLGDLSVRDARQLLTERYARYYVDPRISLQLENQRPVRVYVTGAVLNPGVYLSGKNLSPDTKSHVELGDYSNLFLYPRLYLTDALLQAGGLNYNANVTDIRIKRGGPNPVVVHVNVMDLLNGSVAQDISLRDQDVIEVEALPDNQLVMDQAWESLATSNLGIGQFSVNVLGAVKNPGSYQLKVKDTVLSAISQAGGFTELANKKTIYIMRTTLSGQVVKRELNLADRQLVGKQPIEQWAVLLPNDMIYVQESTGLKAARVGAALGNRASTSALYPFFFRIFRDKGSD